MACISFPLKAVSDIPVSLPRWWGTPWRSKSGIQSEGRAKPIKRGVWECETGPCCRGIDISWRHFFKKNKKKNKYKKVRQKANNIGLLDQKKGWFYLETHQCNGSAIAAYMENAALLESCRCLATEATKHFSDARAYSSVLTNSAGAQTVNILITTIYVDALCFETSLCCHWEEWAPVPKRGVTLCPAQPNGASEHQCPSSSTNPSPAHALSKVLHVTLWLPHNYVYKRDENTDNTYLLCIFFSVFTANSTPADLLQTNKHSTSAPDWCESFVTRRSFCFFFFFLEGNASDLQQPSALDSGLCEYLTFTAALWTRVRERHWFSTWHWPGRPFICVDVERIDCSLKPRRRFKQPHLHVGTSVPLVFPLQHTIIAKSR